jgi:hypothetical protein
VSDETEYQGERLPQYRLMSIPPPLPESHDEEAEARESGVCGMAGRSFGWSTSKGHRAAESSLYGYAGAVWIAAGSTPVRVMPG